MYKAITMIYMKNELSLLASNKNIYQGSNQISEDFMFLHKKWNLLNALWFQAKSYACHWLLNWWSLIHVRWKIAVISVFTDTLTVVIKHQNYSHEENYNHIPKITQHMIHNLPTQAYNKI